MTDIALLALENCMGSSITGPCDALSMASLMDGRQPPLFNLSVITDTGEPVKSFSGMPIVPHKSKDDCRYLDIIFIPVIYGDLTSVLGNTGLVEWLRNQHQKGVIICAVCAGVFLAAQTRLLNNKSATTHWLLADDFKTRFPRVTLKKEKMIVDEGDIITAGGVTAYMDLSLYLVRRFGADDLASTLSKTLLIDPVRQSQAPYTSFKFNTTHTDNDILIAQAFMEEHQTRPLSVDTLAGKVNLGQRTFARRFKRATGDTPLEYLQHLRISKAKSLLETGTKTVDQITRAAGYEDTSSFRRLFKRFTGLSPTAYRKKFKIV